MKTERSVIYANSLVSDNGEAIKPAELRFLQSLLDNDCFRKDAYCARFVRWALQNGADGEAIPKQFQLQELIFGAPDADAYYLQIKANKAFKEVSLTELLSKPYRRAIVYTPSRKGVGHVAVYIGQYRRYTSNATLLEGKKPYVIQAGYINGIHGLLDGSKIFLLPEEFKFREIVLDAAKISVKACEKDGVSVVKKEEKKFKFPINFDIKPFSLPKLSWKTVLGGAALLSVPSLLTLLNRRLK